MALVMGWSTTLTRRGGGFETVCWVGLGALGIFAFRLAHVSLILDTGTQRAWALPRDLSITAELIRALGISVLFTAGGRWVAGLPSFSQSSRLLLPLALPLLGVVALAGLYLPVPSVLTAVGAASTLLLIGGAFGFGWSILVSRCLEPRPATLRRFEAWAVFAVVALLLLGLASQIRSRQLLRQPALTGDEPEYMLTCVSLLDDGDVWLRNNSDANAAQEFGAGGFRFPMRRPIHNIGVPLLAAPAYALGRVLWPAFPHRAVWYEMALITALLAAELYSLGIARGRLFAMALASTVLAPPLLPMAVQIYPEMPVALLAVVCWRRLDGSGPRRILALLALAAMPWFHVKYAALGVGLLVATAIRSSPRRAVPGAIALGIGVAALSLFSGAIYGSYLPTASYGRTATVLSPGIARGAMGLYFDQSFGLLARTPLFLLLAAGALLLWRRHRRDALAVGMVIGSLGVVVASYHLWWAGWSPPGRFLVPIVPFLALVALEGIEPRRTCLGCLAAFLTTVGIAVSVVLIPPPLTWLGGSRALIYQDPVDPSGLGVLFSHGWDFARTLPRFVDAAPRDWAQGVLLIGLVGLVTAVCLRLSRRDATSPRAIVTVIASVLVLGPAALQGIESIVDTRWPDQRWQHGPNQSVRDFLPAVASPQRFRFLPAPPTLPDLVQQYEAEGLRGNYVYFDEYPDGLGRGGSLRCAKPFDPARAPIPIVYRYPVEFVPWVAGRYIATFYLTATSDPTLPAPVLGGAEPASQQPVIGLGIRGSFSVCTGRATSLAQREVTSAELRPAMADAPSAGPIGIQVPFDLACLTPKLEWLVEAHGQPFCVDRIEVTPERLVDP